jgi:hypothetical protein
MMTTCARLNFLYRFSPVRILMHCRHLWTNYQIPPDVIHAVNMAGIRGNFSKLPIKSTGFYRSWATCCGKICHCVSLCIGATEQVKRLGENWPEIKSEVETPNLPSVIFSMICFHYIHHTHTPHMHDAHSTCFHHVTFCHAALLMFCNTVINYRPTLLLYVNLSLLHSPQHSRPT